MATYTRPNFDIVTRPSRVVAAPAPAKPSSPAKKKYNKAPSKVKPNKDKIKKVGINKAKK